METHWISLYKTDFNGIVRRKLVDSIVYNVKVRKPFLVTIPVGSNVTN